jgi:hypothetical protein
LDEYCWAPQDCEKKSEKNKKRKSEAEINTMPNDFLVTEPMRTSR